MTALRLDVTAAGRNLPASVQEDDMPRRRHAADLQTRSGSEPPPDRASAEVAKTTLYIPRSLHTAAKRAAIDAGVSLNGFIIRMLVEQVTTARSLMTDTEPEDMPAKAGARGKRDADIRWAVGALAARLARVEEALGQEAAADDDACAPKRPLSVWQVREAVRAVLIARGAPIPHRALLDHLVQERNLTLPGRDVSENLRTILVHRKSVGFRFIRKRGYWVDDLPVPVQDVPQG